MQNLRVATVQFENASADKDHNLRKIEAIATNARSQGARVIAFHECSVTGYSFARHCSRDELAAIAEPVPNGPSCKRLAELSSRLGIHVLAGLFERADDGSLYNTYACFAPDETVTRYRKIHPFINASLAAGKEYALFEIDGWKCSILICYDNNVIENVRATALLGAQIIFMPHVTMCTPSTRPGAGFVDPALWQNRVADPTSLRLEFDGPKGRQWLMKWLPARAHDNGVYVVFSNPVGMDDDQLKNGCSMVLDPFGDIIAECRKLDDDHVVAELTPEKLELAGGARYARARKPELYGTIMGKPHKSRQHVAWLDED